MKHIVIGLLCVIFFVHLAAQVNNESTMMNINEITLGIQADGRLEVAKSYNPPGSSYTYRWKGVYPREAAGVIYQDGMIWGGRVRDGREPVLRIGGSAYLSGLKTGRIVEKGTAENSDDVNAHIWRIRRDWQTADLTREVFDFFGPTIDTLIMGDQEQIEMKIDTSWIVTPEKIHSIRMQY